MKKQQQRFEEAFKRLQTEVQTKTKRCIDNKVTSTRLIFKNVGPLDVVEPDIPEGVGFKPRTASFTTRSIRNSLVRIHQPDPRSQHFSRRYNQRFPPSTATPVIELPASDPNAPLPWNARDVLDLSHMEETLSKTTARLHELIGPLAQENSESGQDMIPVDFFDCQYKMPPEEVLLREEGKKARGKAFLSDMNGRFTWIPVIITSYDSDKCLYFIETIDTHVVRYISRFNLHFDGENIEDLNLREDMSADVKEEYEKYVKTCCFLDSIPSPPNLLNFLSSKINKEITDDAREELGRTQKMLIFRGLVKLHEQDDLAEALTSLGGDINLFSAPKMKEPPIIETNFKKMQKMIVKSESLIVSPLYIKALHMVFKLLYTKKMEMFNYIRDFFDNKQMSIEEWKEKLFQYEKDIHKSINKLVDDLAKDLTNILKKVIDEGDSFLSNLSQENHPPLQFLMKGDTQFNKFRKLFSEALFVFGKELIEFNLHFFIDLIDYPFKFGTPKEITVDGFTTLTQSIADESFSVRKPFLVFELETEKEEIIKIVSKFHSFLPEEVNVMLNPMRVMFERSDTKTISQFERTQFESFCIDYNMKEFIPSRIIFDNGETKILSDGAADVFHKRLELSVDKIFSCIPILQKYASNVINYFKNFEKPEEFDTVSNIRKIYNDKDVFLLNFPYEIWLSFTKLIFTNTRNTVLDLISDYKNNLLLELQIKMDDMIEDINDGYRDLVEKLKIKPETAYQWSSLKRIAFDSFKIRRDLEIETEEVNTLSNILFELDYGHEYSDLAKEMNLFMWPILVEMELGKAIAQLMQKKDRLHETLTKQIEQIKEEVKIKTEELENCQDEDEALQRKKFVEHIVKKYETAKEVIKELNETSFTAFKSPRVNLWIIVKLSQDQIDVWNKTCITKIDFSETKIICTDWLKNLRKLTSSFSKDKRSLKLLIQTKNDIENILPLFKGCAQLLSPKLLLNHREEMENIIGCKDFEEKTVNQLVALKINQKLDDIDTLYKQSKLEDKANIEIIEAQTLVKTVKFMIERYVITNLNKMFKDFRDTKSIMLAIEMTEGIEEKKKRISHDIAQKLIQYTTAIELFTNIQELISEIRPIESIKSIDFDFTVVTDVRNNYKSILDQLIKDPYLKSFTENTIGIEALKDIKYKLRNVKDSIIKLLSQYRAKIPRLLLVPDSRLIRVFSNNVTAKIDVLPTLFPGTVRFEANNKRILKKIILPLEDELELVGDVSISSDVLSIIPQVEKTIEKSMKATFMKFYKEGTNPTKIPLQLIVLRLLIDPNYDIDTSCMNFEKRKCIEMFKDSVMEADAYPHAKISGDKVIVFVDKKEIEYQFQISNTNSMLYTKTLFAILSDLLLNVSTTPLLCSSEMYSTSSLICQQFSFICGRYCSIIHATSTTTIGRLSNIIEQLNTINVWVCITETELLSEKQMFELAMHVNNSYFLTVTTQMIPPVLSVGKKIFTISSEAFKEHVLSVGQHVYEYQPDAINFACKTLTNYIHPYAILKQIELQIHAENIAFDINFISSFSSILPENVYNTVKDTIVEVPIDECYKINIIKTIISTTDFLSGVHKIMRSILDGNRIILVGGHRFSGTSTCIMAASQSLGKKYVAIAFATDNWIKDLNQTLVNANTKDTVFHIMVPFNTSFLAHISALSFGSAICEGTQSLLKVSDDLILIFEVMTPMTNPELIGTPIIMFKTPLIKSGDLLNYWLANINVPVASDTIDKIKEVVNDLIPSNLQISLFYQLFKMFIENLLPQRPNSLSYIIIYCTFWSNTFSFSKLQDWKDYSAFIIKKLPKLSERTIISELMITKNEQFTLRSAYANPLTYRSDQSIHTKYNKGVCGPISNTIIPTPQFIHGIEIIPMMVKSGVSAAIIGGKGSGKTLLATYLVNQYFKEPDYDVLRIDGINSTKSMLLSSIMSVSQVTIEGIVEPRYSNNVLVLVDPLKVDSGLYGTVLSIIKTGNAIINDEIYTFTRIKFLVVLEESTYQIITCCFPYVIQPYTNQDYEFIAIEIITRIMTSYNVSQQTINQTNQEVQKIMPEFIRKLRNIKENQPLTFFRIIRSVEMLDVSKYASEVDQFLMMKINEYDTDGFDFRLEEPTKFCLDFLQDQVKGTKAFKYVIDEGDETFERSLHPSLCLFTYKIEINETMLRYSEFLLNVCFTPRTNAIIVNDLNIDYECVSKFIAYSLSAKFVVYNSPQQISGLVHDSIASQQIIIVYIRRPEPTILNLICNGIKSYQANLFNSISSDDGFIPEDGAGNLFPYAMLASPPKDENEEIRVRRSLFGTYEFLSFTNVHFVFSVSNLAEIEEYYYPKFVIWDQHNVVIETDDIMINKLLHTVSSYSKKSLVPAIAQFPKVSIINKFLKEKLKSYIEQRHTFLNEVMIVIDSIENAMKDCDARANILRDQIKIDETMKEGAQEAVNNAQAVVVNFTGDLNKCQAEYQIICEEDARLAEYMEKDSIKTMEAYKKVQRKAQKSFTAEEQYKLYCHQNPSQDIKDLFAAYCILIGLTPRDGDYWPEARGILKSGRMPQGIQLFDPSDISKENLEKFDVAMQKVVNMKFRFGSALYHLCQWLKAVHVHSKRTHFNPCVNTKISETMLAKSAKEEEITAVKQRLDTAQKDANDLIAAMNDLQAKINDEKMILENTILFSEISKKISRVFPSLKKDLQEFSDGDKNLGKNSDNFILKASHELVTKPLFDPEVAKKVDSEVTEMMSANFYDPQFFVGLKELLGVEDPLITSLLSGDRIITVYDPYDVAAELTGHTNDSPHQVVSHMNFVYADNMDDIATTSTKILDSAEMGKILVVKHADELVSCPFFCAVANKTTVSAVFNNITVSIDSDFKAVLLVDHPPEWMPPHMSFIAELNLDQSHIYSALANDSSLIKAAEKLKSSELSVLQQRENLYYSLQNLHSHIKEIHSTKAILLNDPELQTTLLINTQSTLNEDIIFSQHSLDNNKWITEVTPQIIEFCGKLQGLCRMSPVYLWPLHKIDEIFRRFRETKGIDKKEIFSFFCSRVAATMLKRHRLGIEELKNSTPPPVSDLIEEAKNDGKKLFLVHSDDLSVSAKFFAKMNIPEKSQFFVSENEENEKIIKSISKLVEDETQENIAVSFFGGEKQLIDKVCMLFLSRFKSEKKMPNIYIHINTYFKVPASFVNESVVIALK